MGVGLASCADGAQLAFADAEPSRSWRRGEICRRLSGHHDRVLGGDGERCGGAALAGGSELLCIERLGGFPPWPLAQIFPGQRFGLADGL
jgi:hypothetical protein